MFDFIRFHEISGKEIYSPEWLNILLSFDIVGSAFTKYLHK